MLPNQRTVFRCFSQAICRCLGYKDLGALQGRVELIRRSKEFCEKNDLPLLSFPEGAMTSGSTGLLKFSTWPFEVCYIPLVSPSIVFIVVISFLI